MAPEHVLALLFFEAHVRTLSSRARKIHLWTSITCPEDLICEQREWATAITTDLPWDKAHQEIIIGQGNENGPLCARYRVGPERPIYGL